MTNSRALAAWIGNLVVMFAVAGPQQVEAQEAGSAAGTYEMQPNTTEPGHMMPSMNAFNGRKLFASKGCVVCHSVNGIGGADAAPLDASTMAGMTNPFDFVANMWRGAVPMIELQEEELGGQVEFTGQELADIIAFLHHADEQKKFSEGDVPPEIKAAMTAMERGGGDEKPGNEDGMNKMKMKPESGSSGN